MNHQVTAADYERCADDGACPRAPIPLAHKDLRSSVSAGTMRRPMRTG